MKQILTLLGFTLLLISGCKTAPTSTNESAVAPIQLPRVIGRVEPQLALVIGNSRYQHNPLKNPINDATDVANVLKNMGFKVSLKTNLTQRALNAIYKFEQRLSNSGGIGLFYLSGHGARVDGENYLLPTDNDRIRDERDLQYYAIRADKVLEIMQTSRKGLNIIVLDACRDHPYRSVGKNRVYPTYPTDFELSCCSIGKVSFEVSGFLS